MPNDLQNSQGAVSGIILDSDIQRFAGGIFANEADKTYATFEESELKALPKSLFYDGATSTWR